MDSHGTDLMQVGALLGCSLAGVNDVIQVTNVAEDNDLPQFPPTAVKDEELLGKIRRLEQRASEYVSDFGKDSVFQLYMERLEVLRQEVRDSTSASAQQHVLAASTREPRV